MSRADKLSAFFLCLAYFSMWAIIVALCVFVVPYAKASDVYPVQMGTNFKIPQTESPYLDKLLRSRSITYYKLGPAYQQYVPTARLYKIYSDDVLVDFNSNKDFPWETTFGLNKVKQQKLDDNYYTINFLYTKKPVLVFDNRPHFWIFPDDCMVGEIIYLKDGTEWLPMEIRLRTKKGTTWEPNRFVPVRDRNEFITLTGKRYEPSKKYIFLRNNVENEVMKLEGMVERVPPLDKETVRLLLSRPFKRATDTQWSADTSVPASDDVFSIVPKDYSLGLLPSIDSDSCSKCHNQTQISVNRLVPKEPLIKYNPLKVGNIRGSDGVFSWHPFHEASIHTEVTNQRRLIKYRDYDLKNRIVELYNPAKKYTGYKLTYYVDMALAPEEKVSLKEFLP